MVFGTPCLVLCKVCLKPRSGKPEHDPVWLPGVEPTSRSPLRETGHGCRFRGATYGFLAVALENEVFWVKPAADTRNESC